MTLATRRTFRLAFVVALSLVIAYAFAMPFPYFAPLFAVILTIQPSAPPAGKALLIIVVVINLIMGIGLFLSPFLSLYPVTILLVIAVGVYLASLLNVGKGKMAPAMLLTIAITLIPTIALLQYSLAADIVQSMALGIAVSIICQWVVYPFFPEDEISNSAAVEPEILDDAHWVALRSTLVLMPVVLAAFINPMLFKTLIIKTSILSLAPTRASTFELAKQLILATCLGGVIAILFWFGLKLWPSLWLFFLWTLMVFGFIACKLYGVIETHYPALFWQDVAVTVLILVGPAVMDSATGNDVYKGFFMRFSLFLIVAIYASFAVGLLESWHQSRTSKNSVSVL